MASEQASTRVKFTAGRVADFRCPSGKPVAFLWDSASPGLGIRATTNADARSFIFQARLNRETIRTTIGSVRAWDLDKAQAEARRLQTLIDRGIDPRLDRAAQLAANQAANIDHRKSAITLDQAWPDYIKSRRAKWSARHLADHENVAQRAGTKSKVGDRKKTAGALASLLDTRLVDITPDHVAAWLSAEAAERPTQARLAFGALRGFLNWAADRAEYRGVVDPAACAGRVARQNLPAKGRKSDCLQREQLKVWFAAVRGLDNLVIASYLQALLITGARREELGGLKWQNVDFKWSALTIRDKVDGTRTIPLTPYVSSLLSALPRRNDWVFSSTTSKSGRLQEPRLAHGRALRVAEIEGLTLHGLRRSFSTLSEWVEVPAGVVAQIMGHKPSATAERHYKSRPLDLLRMWHVKIEQWVLNEAGVEFVAEQERLRLVANQDTRGDASNTEA